MIYIETGSTDPTFNLAAEEYCLRNLESLPNILMLWQNDNSIIIGRYQNAEKEINIDAVRRGKVKVVRRSTGGGAVYHDLGNLNYSLIQSVSNPARLDLAGASLPMVEALNKLGIPAVSQGRNDILLEGKKISGAAQCVRGGRLLHHGTLLFSSNMDVLQDVLNVDSHKLYSKGISSVKSRVMNISDYPGFNMDITLFWKKLLDALGPVRPYAFSVEELEGVHRLQAEKYGTWQWNRGQAPAYKYSNERHFPGGKVEVSLNVKGGLITNCSITGDFLGLTDIRELEEMLEGQRHERSHLLTLLENIPLPLYLGGIEPEELLDCMIEAVL